MIPQKSISTGEGSKNSLIKQENLKNKYEKQHSNNLPKLTITFSHPSLNRLLLLLFSQCMIVRFYEVSRELLLLSCSPYSSINDMGALWLLIFFLRCTNKWRPLYVVPLINDRKRCHSESSKQWSVLGFCYSLGWKHTWYLTFVCGLFTRWQDKITIA